MFKSYKNEYKIICKDGNYLLKQKIIIFFIFTIWKEEKRSKNINTVLDHYNKLKKVW